MCISRGLTNNAKKLIENKVFMLRNQHDHINIDRSKNIKNY